MPPGPCVKDRRLSIQHDDFPKTLSKISDDLMKVRIVFVFSKLDVIANNRSIPCTFKSKFKRIGDNGYENSDALG